ncbi:hypothetical protein EJ05DRAFT_370535 [Pseudovirgaria hyperparasitica]|uniref:DNA-directed RNA polymerase subunit n=1 Tax=Pseudovirgaria hyperparasitica TaxID=470096 RepID=A0A6A6W6Q0_9PEZI|nr:uncharacterized protein EJ05DRAFT_370535 [Pseudovirgaria hyperparasitica]KAF2757879.1 hypothetical protein EJ05DRAFT_370535 [Pseudovirgaria hyperparasitica]
MLLFCPVCSNLLTVSKMPVNPLWPEESGKNRFECRTCPYMFMITQRMMERKPMKRKEVEDVLGGEDAWANVDKTDVQCPNDKCGNTQAFFYQLQIRSADEPMTSFYKCTSCARQWNE